MSSYVVIVPYLWSDWVVCIGFRGCHVNIAVIKVVEEKFIQNLAFSMNLESRHHLSEASVTFLSSIATTHHNILYICHLESKTQLPLTINTTSSTYRHGNRRKTLFTPIRHLYKEETVAMPDITRKYAPRTSNQQWDDCPTPNYQKGSRCKLISVPWVYGVMRLCFSIFWLWGLIWICMDKDWYFVCD